MSQIVEKDGLESDITKTIEYEMSHIDIPIMFSNTGAILRNCKFNSK